MPNTLLNEYKALTAHLAPVPEAPDDIACAPFAVAVTSGRPVSEVLHALEVQRRVFSPELAGRKGAMLDEVEMLMSHLGAPTRPRHDAPTGLPLHHWHRDWGSKQPKTAMFLVQVRGHIVVAQGGWTIDNRLPRGWRSISVARYRPQLTLEVMR